ncbi:hypothetical protein M1614_00325 [Candidatus Marsarchaeota archaeon]|jgi:hypothetical protein|nr:hypothetical protein [Candidatus Marsarchaeota archaeon]MCL5090155.1 hypothetical protein [Candidatus Marsarchaeota archaeon]
MELIVKTIVGVVILVIAIIAIFMSVNISHINKINNITVQQAESLIISDLKQHSPNANISILNASKSKSHPGSWDIMIRTVYNNTSVCPSVVTQQFDYPATGFLNTTTIYSNYSENLCHVYIGFSSQSGLVNNIIGLPAIAIATPYNKSFTPLVNYVNKYGYQNVSAKAKYFDVLNISNNSFHNVWFINYTAKNSNYSYLLIINRAGEVSNNYTSNNIT